MEPKSTWRGARYGRTIAGAMTELSEIFRRNEIPYGYRIGYLFNFFTGPIYKEVERELDIIRPDFATMFCAAHLRSITARDVTLLTGIPKNSVSRAVAKLSKRKLLKRTGDGEDGRRVILTLTAAGQALYEDVLARFREREARMVAVLSPAERRQLDALLAKLVLREDDWARDY
jgi:MarR family transcriptional regulator, temperature-dependent positive regulator of motility